jgi:nucleosome binding factor SPN SPT16 subunit
MASDYLLKHPLTWLASFPPTPSSFDREEGLVLSLRADVLVIYVFLTDTLHTLPLNTRVVKIKPVNINQYLKDLKNCFINNYDMDRTTERMLRLYIASVEEKNERVKLCVESKEEDEEEEEEEEVEDEYSSDDQHEEEDEEDEDESESESESESDDEDEDDSSSCSSSSDEDDEDCIDFKVVIESPSMETEVRGELYLFLQHSNDATQ